MPCRSAQRGTSLTPRRILLAEDDPKDVELILSSLGECDVSGKVVVVRDGAEALEYLQRRGSFAGMHFDLQVLAALVGDFLGL